MKTKKILAIIAALGMVSATGALTAFADDTDTDTPVIGIETDEDPDTPDEPVEDPIDGEDEEPDEQPACEGCHGCIREIPVTEELIGEVSQITTWNSQEISTVFPIVHGYKTLLVDPEPP